MIRMLIEKTISHYKCQLFTVKPVMLICQTHDSERAYKAYLCVVQSITYAAITSHWCIKRHDNTTPPPGYRPNILGKILPKAIHERYWMSFDGFMTHLPDSESALFPYC